MLWNWTASASPRFFSAAVILARSASIEAACRRSAAAWAADAAECACWDFSAAWSWSWMASLPGTTVSGDGAWLALPSSTPALPCRTVGLPKEFARPSCSLSNFFWSTCPIANSTMNSTMSRVIMSA